MWTIQEKGVEILFTVCWKWKEHTALQHAIPVMILNNKHYSDQTQQRFLKCQHYIVLTDKTIKGVGGGGV